MIAQWQFDEVYFIEYIFLLSTLEFLRYQSYSIAKFRQVSGNFRSMESGILYKRPKTNHSKSRRLVLVLVTSRYRSNSY